MTTPDARSVEPQVGGGRGQRQVDDRFAALLAPVGAAEVWREVRGLDESWGSEARTFVTPEGRLLSSTLKPVLGPFPGEVRQVGSTSFTFLNEDGNRVYLATGECQSVAGLAPNEYGAEPWSADALALLADVTVDSSDAWAVAPDGWTQIEGGFSELLYETTFTVLDAAGTPSAEARLVQTDAPLGHVLAAGGGSASAGADPVSTAAAQAAEQGGVPTTVTETGPAPAAACGPREGG